MKMRTLNLKFDAGGVEVKEGVISGYASLFGIVDQGGDKIMSGAYTKSLKSAESENRKVKMLWQHDPTQPIGVWDEVKEDDTGLRVRGRILSDVAKGKEAIALINAGAMDGLSIGYRTRKATKGDDGTRELRDLDLWEVSLVTFPMQLEAGISDIKAMGDVAEQKRFLENSLRDVGFSAKEAKHGAAVLVEQVLGARDAAEAAAEMVDELKQFLRDIRA
jgi:HK97 family phage prohead protease